jgi:hypothetical protein
MVVYIIHKIAVPSSEGTVCVHNKEQSVNALQGYNWSFGSVVQSIDALSGKVQGFLIL